MLNFNPQTGLTSPSTAEIRESIAADWVAAFAKDGLPTLNTEPETPAGQLIDSEAALVQDKNSELLYLANQFNPLYASGIWQAALGQIYFLTPKLEQPSVAVCTCTGLPGTLIALGSLIRSDADNTQWKALESVTIPDGASTVDVSFACVEAGQITAAPNTLTRIVTTTPGWDTVTNPVAAVVGTLAETQAAFERRRYESVAANSRGSVYSLYGALAQIDGVIDVVVLENTTNEPVIKSGVSIPGHSVHISIVGGTADDIAATIYAKKDMGCGTAGNTVVSHTDSELPGAPVFTYNIERPAPANFGVRVTVKELDEIPENFVQTIRQTVMNEFNGLNSGTRIGVAQTVFSSRFVYPVISAGASSLVSVGIAFPVADIENAAWADVVTINADTEPVLAAENIQVVFVRG